LRLVAGFLFLALAAAAGCAGPRTAAVKGSFEMPYPPPGEPVPDTIHHVPTGLEVSFEGAMDMASGARLVAVGETHDSVHAHRVELEIIRELERRFPGRVAIGMEMFRSPQQETLDRWSRGELSELEFLKEVKWYGNWGSDFGYYRAILEFARDNRIDIIALNPPKDLERAVKKSGLDNVPEELRGQLPEMGDADPYQREMLKAVYEDHLPAKGMFESFYRTQVLWEESMAERVAEYLASPRGEGKRIVTMTGGWHVRYGFGLPKKVLRRMPVSYVIVLPEEVNLPPEKREEKLMDIDLPRIPLLPGDFVWYVPYEDLEDNQVRLGVMLTEEEGKLVVEGVTPGSPAGNGGVEKGDRIVALDGEPVADLTDIRYVLGRKKTGDRGTVTVRRGDSQKTIDLLFTPLPKAKPRH
jgi:uncharacterized iron-regulated protein